MSVSPFGSGFEELRDYRLVEAERNMSLYETSDSFYTEVESLGKGKNIKLSKRMRILLFFRCMGKHRRISEKVTLANKGKECDYIVPHVPPLHTLPAACCGREYRPNRTQVEKSTQVPDVEVTLQHKTTDEEGSIHVNLAHPDTDEHLLQYCRQKQDTFVKLFQSYGLTLQSIEKGSICFKFKMESGDCTVDKLLAEGKLRDLLREIYQEVFSAIPGPARQESIVIEVALTSMQKVKYDIASTSVQIGDSNQSFLQGIRDNEEMSTSHEHTAFPQTDSEQPDVKTSQADSQQPDVNTSQTDSEQPDVKTSQADSQQPDVKTSQADSQQPDVKTSQADSQQPDVKTSQADSQEPDVKTSQADLEQPDVKTSQADLEQPDVNTSQADLEQPGVKTSQADSQQPDVNMSQTDSEQPDVKTSQADSQQPDVNTSQTDSQQPDVKTSQADSQQPDVKTSQADSQQPDVNTSQPDSGQSHTKAVERDLNEIRSDTSDNDLNQFPKETFDSQLKEVPLEPIQGLLYKNTGLTLNDDNDDTDTSSGKDSMVKFATSASGMTLGDGDTSDSGPNKPKTEQVESDYEEEHERVDTYIHPVHAYAKRPACGNERTAARSHPPSCQQDSGYGSGTCDTNDKPGYDAVILVRATNTDTLQVIVDEVCALKTISSLEFHTHLNQTRCEVAILIKTHCIIFKDFYDLLVAFLMYPHLLRVITSGSTLLTLKIKSDCDYHEEVYTPEDEAVLIFEAQDAIGVQKVVRELDNLKSISLAGLTYRTVSSDTGHTVSVHMERQCEASEEFLSHVLHFLTFFHLRRAVVKHRVDLSIGVVLNADTLVNPTSSPAPIERPLGKKSKGFIPFLRRSMRRMKKH